jgi:hypothetical protein
VKQSLQNASYYTRQDTPTPTVQVAPAWSLVDTASKLAVELDTLRPWKGPQPVTKVGTPREALTSIWDSLASARNIQVAELVLTVQDRESFDNTLQGTWPDRPKAAQVHASVTASGQRVVAGKTETVSLQYEGRFEEVKGLLAHVWPFQNPQNQGQLAVTIAVSFKFQPAPELTDKGLESYRAALTNANYGNLEVRLVPVRARKAGGA